MKMPKTLVLVVDTQYDFIMADGKLPVPGAEEIIVPGIRFLAGLNPDTTAGVLFTFDTHTRDTFLGSPENLGNPTQGRPGFPLHCEKGTPGWENVFNPRLVPAGIPVHRLEKGVFDLWEEPGLALTEIAHDPGDPPRARLRDDFFTHRQADFDTVLVLGVASDYCVRWAADGLLARGFHVEVPASLTRGIQRQFAQVKREHFADRAVRLI